MVNSLQALSIARPRTARHVFSRDLRVHDCPDCDGDSAQAGRRRRRVQLNSTVIRESFTVMAPLHGGCICYHESSTTAASITIYRHGRCCGTTQNVKQAFLRPGAETPVSR